MTVASPGMVAFNLKKHDTDCNYIFCGIAVSK